MMTILALGIPILFLAFVQVSLHRRIQRLERRKKRDLL
jgi:hypothetical protein